MAARALARGAPAAMLACAALSCALLFAPAYAPLYAHHGAALYYNDRVITLEGTVAEFQFVNPHIQIMIDVPGPKGELQRWTIEYPSPGVASRQGWTRDMLKPGDHIVYRVHPAKNGTWGGRGAAKMIVNGKLVGDRNAAF